MHVRRVVLENIRGFESLDFSFERTDGKTSGWFVITGDNGSGKTALLKSIAIALVGPDVARILQPSFRGWIREGHTLSQIAVEIVPSNEDKFTTGRRYESTFWSELELEKRNAEPTLRPGDRRRKKKKGPLNGPWAGAAGWFVVGYGPFRRLYGSSTEAQRLMSGPVRVARLATMFKEDATLGECEAWLKDLNYKKLENRERETKILDAVLRMLNHEFLRNNVSVDRIDSNGLWVRHADGTVLPLSDMSEGYRAALAMMIDILRHMSENFGADDLVTDVNGKPVAAPSGVVLIDEVDAHLHPEWQRQIAFWLKEHFPNIQFIVTTHSALVCQAADEPCIYHLPAPGSPDAPFQVSRADYKKIIASRADQILLSPAFGLEHTRSPRAVLAVESFARLKAKEAAVGLTDEERVTKAQLSLFVEALDG